MKKIYSKDIMDLYDPNANTIIAEGEIYGRKWWVVSYHGHPNGYVEILDNEFEDNINELMDRIPFYIHGGLTFSGHLKIANKNAIGWDYAHYEDYVNYGYGFCDHGKKYSVYEIIDDCIFACEQIEGVRAMMNI